MERRRLFEHALGEQWGERATGYRRHVGIDPKMDHPFNEFLTDVCESRDGYASTPEVGTAIMWDSTSRGELAYPCMRSNIDNITTLASRRNQRAVQFDMARRV